MSPDFKPWPAFKLQSPYNHKRPVLYIGNPEIFDNLELFLKSSDDPLYLIHQVMEKNQLIDQYGTFNYNYFGAPHYAEKKSLGSIKQILLIELIKDTFLDFFIKNLKANFDYTELKDPNKTIFDESFLIKPLTRFLQSNFLNAKNTSLAFKKLTWQKFLNSDFDPDLEKLLTSNKKLLLEKAEKTFLRSFQRALFLSYNTKLEIKPHPESFSLFWNDQEYYAVPNPRAMSFYIIKKLKKHS